MEKARKCSHCGARPKDIDAAYCQFCGTELPQRAQAQVQVITPHGDLNARFVALEKHADLPQLHRHTPDSTREGLGMAGTVVFGGFFTVISLFITAGFAKVGGPIAIFPLIFVGAGVVMIVKGVTSAAQFSSAPMRRQLVAVIDERSRVSGGGKNSSASTTYFATVQDRDGERGEYRVHARLAGQIAPGDLGVAYFKSKYMLDFKRVDV